MTRNSDASREDGNAVARWTPDMVEMLKGLRLQGETGQVIAIKLNERFGAKLTRSAIAGKVRALGLTLKKNVPYFVAHPVMQSHVASQCVRSPIVVEACNHEANSPRVEGTDEFSEISDKPTDAPETIDDQKLSPELLVLYEKYNERLSWRPSSNVWEIADLLEHEFQCQEAYKNLPLELRKKMGFPSFCRWLLPSDTQSVIYCGALVSSESRRLDRHKPRCSQHLRHGFAVSRSDRTMQAKPVYKATKTVLVK